VLAIEYPGYGVYEGTPSEQAIFEDCEQVVDFVTKQLKFMFKNIYLLGRSMGSGPVCYLASKYNQLAGAILMSPFLSIRDVAKCLVGHILSFFLKDQYFKLGYCCLGSRITKESETSDVLFS